MSNGLASNTPLIRRRSAQQQDLIKADAVGINCIRTSMQSSVRGTFCAVFDVSRSPGLYPFLCILALRPGYLSTVAVLL